MQLSSVCNGLQRLSILKCGDSSGIIKGCIIGLGRNKSGTGKIGDRIKISVRDKKPDVNISKKVRAIIIRSRKEIGRKDGTSIKFDENAFAVIEKNKLKATKINGPVLLETRHSCKNLAKIIF
ncbi:50S ribosomal protein L14 [Babesia microti strain RI]|uniref:50S ribosomal protein L14 n=1 Tax=Babesia microti (strain RI) TaxID=1133968 RepID=I7IHJ4_BABMR|nr:50S ribosomal protein L14 [Babesia microti strain RI]CCF75917.1 50S ribosomal protein L14 [Babesia microti strain RI]|eukprot:XP_012650325.1 50S ribosomal protein L14 [Babesia microti strain RI]